MIETILQNLFSWFIRDGYISVGSFICGICVQLEHSFVD